MTIPNQLTVTRIILTPIFAWLFLSNNLFLHQLSLPIFFIAALTDWYDGWLARKFNYMSNLGKFLDPLADKILTSTAFIVFASIGILQFWMVVIIVVRDLLITSLRVFAQYRKHIISPSYLAKVKTFIQMTFLYYLLIVYVGETYSFLSFIDRKIFNILLNETFIFYSMLVITVLTFYTGLTYLYSNRYTLEELIKF